MTGFYDLDIYGDAAKSEGGRLKMDLLAGKILHGQPSESLRLAAAKVPKELARLCERQGGKLDEIKKAEVTFSSMSGRLGFTVLIEDQEGKSSETDYHGCESARPMELDQRGRARRRPTRSV